MNQDRPDGPRGEMYDALQALRDAIVAAARSDWRWLRSRFRG